eukprot:13616175-Alexandrium_andersonii.AAC.1
MSASLVGSEMCIRDSASADRGVAAHDGGAEWQPGLNGRWPRSSCGCAHAGARKRAPARAAPEGDNQRVKSASSAFSAAS